MGTGTAAVQGFVKGAYAAAIGTILGACILLGRIAIGDWLTAIIAAVSMAALMRWNVNNPLLIGRPHRIPTAAADMGDGQIAGRKCAILRKYTRRSTYEKKRDVRCCVRIGDVGKQHRPVR
jgi:hypothetical protein